MNLPHGGPGPCRFWPSRTERAPASGGWPRALARRRSRHKRLPGPGAAARQRIRQRHRLGPPPRPAGHRRGQAGKTASTGPVGRQRKRRRPRRPGWRTFPPPHTAALGHPEGVAARSRACSPAAHPVRRRTAGGKVTQAYHLRSAHPAHGVTPSGSTIAASRRRCPHQAMSAPVGIVTGITPGASPHRTRPRAWHPRCSCVTSPCSTPSSATTGLPCGWRLALIPFFKRRRQASPHERPNPTLTCGTPWDPTADLLLMMDQVRGMPRNCPPDCPQRKEVLGSTRETSP